MSKTIVDEIPLEQYIDFTGFDTGITFADDLFARCAGSNIPQWMFIVFRQYLKLNYYGMYYSLIPLTVENDDNKLKYYMHNISKIICRTFLINKDILNSMDEETKKLKNLSYEKIGDNERRHTGSDTSSKKAMTEISPITSGVRSNGQINYDIETPNGRSLGNDTTEYNSSFIDSFKESNPYYFNEFMRTLEKHNIFNIFDKAIRTVIKEFYEVY